MIKLLAGKNEGRFTLEAAIVFPAVIAITILLTYMGTILYHFLVAKSVTDYSAKRAAETWDKGLNGFISGDDGLTEAGGTWWLYQRLADKSKFHKQQAVEEYISLEIDKKAFFKAAETRATVELVDHILYRSVVIETEVLLDTPIGEYAFSAVSEEVIKDPAELIRNVDLLLDMKKGLEERYPGISSWTEKFTETIEGIKDTISDTVLGGD